MQILNSKRDNTIPKKYELTNYFIVIASIMVVNPFFVMITNIYLFIFCIFLLVVANRRNIEIINNKIILILTSIYLLIVIQGFIFKGFSIAIIYYPIINFYVPFLIYAILGVSFFKYFIKVLFVIAIFTTPLWLLQTFVPAVDTLMKVGIEWVFDYSWSSVPRSLLFYTAAWSNQLYNESLGIYRNSGLFHEPGAYAVFLNLGIIINTLLTGKYFDRINKLFIACILTTLSTAGYIALFLILIIFLYKSKTYILFKVLALILFIFISYSTFQSEEFLRTKIEYRYDLETYAVDTKAGSIRSQSGRFYAFIISYNNFLMNPVFGRGILYVTGEKAKGEMHADSSYSYGFMGLLATYGLFFGSFYLFNIHKGLQNLNLNIKKNKFFVFSLFLALMALLATQIFITATIVVIIFFTGVYTKEKKKTGE